jgi:hypothetical protein
MKRLAVFRLLAIAELTVAFSMTSFAGAAAPPPKDVSTVQITRNPQSAPNAAGPAAPIDRVATEKYTNWNGLDGRTILGRLRLYLSKNTETVQRAARYLNLAPNAPIKVQLAVVGSTPDLAVTFQAKSQSLASDPAARTCAVDLLRAFLSQDLLETSAMDKLREANGPKITVAYSGSSTKDFFAAPPGLTMPAKDLLEEIGFPVGTPTEAIPYTPDLCFDVAYKCYCQGRFQDSLALVTRSLELAPRAATMYLKAVSELALGYAQDAEESAHVLKSHKLPDSGGVRRLQERLSDDRVVRLESLIGAL